MATVVESTIAVPPELSHPLPHIVQQTLAASTATTLNNNPNSFREMKPYHRLSFTQFVAKSMPPFNWQQFRQVMMDQTDDNLIPSENLPDDKLDTFYAEMLEVAKKLLSEKDLITTTPAFSSSSDQELAQVLHAEINEEVLDAEWKAFSEDMPLIHNLDLLSDQCHKYYETDDINVKEQIVDSIFSAIESSASSSTVTTTTYFPAENFNIISKLDAAGEKTVSIDVMKVSDVDQKQNYAVVNATTRQVNIHEIVRDIVRKLELDLIKLKQQRGLNLNERDRQILTSVDVDEAEQQQQQLQQQLQQQQLLLQQQQQQQAQSGTSLRTSAGSFPKLEQEEEDEEQEEMPTDDADSVASMDGSAQEQDDIDEQEQHQAAAAAAAVDDETLAALLNHRNDADTDIIMVPVEHAPEGVVNTTGHVTDAPERLEFAEPPQHPATTTVTPTKLSAGLSELNLKRTRSTSRSSSTQQQQQQPSPSKKLMAISSPTNSPPPPPMDDADAAVDTLMKVSEQQQQRIRLSASPALSTTITAASESGSRNVSPVRTSTVRTRSTSLQRHQQQQQQQPQQQQQQMQPISDEDAAAAAAEPTSTGYRTPSSSPTIRSSGRIATPHYTPAEQPPRIQMLSEPQTDRSPDDAEDNDDDEEEEDEEADHTVKEPMPINPAAAASRFAAVAAAAAATADDDDTDDMDDNYLKTPPIVTNPAFATQLHSAAATVAAACSIATQKESKNSSLLTVEELLSGRWMGSGATTIRIIIEHLVTHAPAFLAHFDEVRKNEARDYHVRIRLPVCARDLLRFYLQHYVAKQQQQQQQSSSNAAKLSAAAAGAPSPTTTITVDKPPYAPLHLASNLMYASCVCYNEGAGRLGQTAANLLGSTQDELVQHQVANKLIANFFMQKSSSTSSKQHHQQ